MPYTPQTWTNGSGGGTPLSAARLNAMETGIQRASPAAVSSTTLPGTPFDGQEVFYAANATLGVYWHLRYRSASASIYKWELVGGSSLYSEVLTAETTTSATYVDLATVGPSITVPLAGEYEIEFSARLNNTGTGNTSAAPKIGAAATSDNDSIINNTAQPVQAARMVVRTVSAASTVVKLQYRSNGALTLTATNRNLSIRPIRVI